MRFHKPVKRIRRSIETLETRVAPSDTLVLIGAAIAAAHSETQQIAPPDHSHPTPPKAWAPDETVVPLTIIPPGRSQTTVSPQAIDGLALDGLLGGEFDPVSIDLGDALGPDLTEEEPMPQTSKAPVPLANGLNVATAQGGSAAPGGGGGGGGSGAQPDGAAGAMNAAIAAAAASTPASPKTAALDDYQPPPPSAFDDTAATQVDYWTYHDTPLTSQGSVQDNDMNGMPVTSQVVTTTTSGILTLNTDGTFFYTPNYHFAGIDTFTYVNVDEFGSSDVATVDIRVTEYPPVATDDGIDSAGNYLYQVTWNETENDENGHSLAIAGGMDSTENPPSIQADDYSSGGPNSNNLTSLLDSPPAHGTIARFSDPNAIGAIDPDGGFVYTPNPGETGVDHFTYHDTDGMDSSNVATVFVFIVSVNLEIWDGGDWNDPQMVPKKVPDDVELTRGAFTVYNNNDTNGDVMVDSLQSPVAATADGRPEVDLMKIVVNPPGQPAPNGPTSVTLELTPGLDLWRDSSKVAPYPHMGDPSTGEETMIDTSLLPMELWVEATVRSNSLRDMGVKETYGEVWDLVHVTSVWATASAITYNDTAQDIFNSTDVDPTIAPGLAIGVLNGTGIIPVKDNGMDNPGGVRNGILIQYNISPAIPFGSTETWEDDGVMFDGARKMTLGAWAQNNAGDPYVQKTRWDWPTFSEASNDDPSDVDDESPNVLKRSDGSNIFYVYDAAGLRLNYPSPGTMPNEYILQFQAWDFLRVSFNGTRPSGGSAEAPIAQGSRVSAYLPWYSQISVTSANFMVNGQPTVLWTRTGAQHANLIEIGSTGFTHLGPPFDF